MKKLVFTMALIFALVLFTTACSTDDGNDHEGVPPAESRPFVQYEMHLMTFSDNGKINVCADNQFCKESATGQFITHEQRSLDGAVLAFTTDENELYITDGENLTKVADSVHQFQFHLSVSGDGLVYSTEDASENSELCYYDVVTGKDTLVAEGRYSYRAEISPDGKTVAYIDKADDGFVLMLFDGKQSHKLADGETSLLGLSDGGEYIYTICETAENCALYCYNSKGNRCKIGEIDEHSTLQFNADHTQIMFNHDGRTFISACGQEARKVSNDVLELITPPKCGTCVEYHYTTCPVTDLLGHVYTTNDNEVWLIERNVDNSVKLLSKATYVRLDASGEYLYYIYDGEELRCAKISDGDRASQTCKVIVDDYVFDYVVTSDRSLVYYIEDDSLYSVDGENGGEATEIFDDVNARYLAISSEDVLCFISEGDAYVYMDGIMPSRVRRDTVALSSSPNGFVYAIAEDGSCFLPIQEKLAQDRRDYEIYQSIVDVLEKAKQQEEHP